MRERMVRRRMGGGSDERCQYGDVSVECVASVGVERSRQWDWECVWLSGSCQDAELVPV